MGIFCFEQINKKMSYDPESPIYVITITYLTEECYFCLQI